MIKKIFIGAICIGVSTLVFADVSDYQPNDSKKEVTVKQEQKADSKDTDKGIDYDDFFDSMDKQSEMMKKQHERDMQDPSYAKYYNES